MLCGIYFSPVYKNWKEDKIALEVKRLNNIFLEKTLAEYNNDKTQKVSDIAKKIADELNDKSVNPFNKNEKMYSFDKSCKEKTAIEVNEKMSMITLSTCDKKEEIYSRIVIIPPSFVKYFKSDN